MFGEYLVTFAAFVVGQKCQLVVRVIISEVEETTSERTDRATDGVSTSLLIDDSVRVLIFFVQLLFSKNTFRTITLLVQLLSFLCTITLR